MKSSVSNSGKNVGEWKDLRIRERKEQDNLRFSRPRSFDFITSKIESLWIDFFQGYTFHGNPLVIY